MPVNTNEESSTCRKSSDLTYCTYKYDFEGSTHAWLDEILLKEIVATGARYILELGCGNGCFARRLNELGYDVLGCDPEESAIAIAKAVPGGARFCVLGVYDSPDSLSEGPFELVLASEVLEHLVLPGKLTQFARSKLKDGGILVLSVPYYGSYIKNLLCSLLNRWDEHFVPLWDGGHIKFWSLKTLKMLLTESGFEVVRYRTCSRISRLLDWIWPNNLVLIARKLPKKING